MSDQEEAAFYLFESKHSSFQIRAKSRAATGFLQLLRSGNDVQDTLGTKNMCALYALEISLRPILPQCTYAVLEAMFERSSWDEYKHRLLADCARSNPSLVVENLSEQLEQRERLYLEAIRLLLRMVEDQYREELKQTLGLAIVVSHQEHGNWVHICDMALRDPSETADRYIWIAQKDDHWAGIAPNRGDESERIL